MTRREDARRQGKSRDCPLSDRELVDLARQGNHDAFQVLIRLYQQHILNLSFRLLGNGEEARELAADIFAEAFKSIKSFRHDASFGTWIYQIALNLGYSRLRKKIKHRSLFIPTDELARDETARALMSDERERPGDSLIEAEKKREVRYTLGCLPKDQANILILHSVESLSYAEMSEVLRCPIGTVMSRLSRAREAFRKVWNEQAKNDQPDAA